MTCGFSDIASTCVLKATRQRQHDNQVLSLLDPGLRRNDEQQKGRPDHLGRPSRFYATCLLQSI
jgi:hypothetical protein